MSEHSSTKNSLSDLFYAIIGVVTICAVSIGIVYLLWSLPVEVLISACLFVILWVTLGNKVFKPFVEVIEEREARTEGDEKLALEVVKEADAVADKIEQALQFTRLKGIKARDSRVLRAKEEAGQIIDEVKELAQRELGKARQELDELRSKVRDDMTQEVTQISEVMVVKVIERAGARVIH